MMTGETYMKLRYCAAVVLASVLSACTGIGPMLPSDTDIMQDYPVTLTVSQDEMTRIGLSGNSLSWETGDRIQLTAVTAGIEVSDTIATSVLKVFDIDPEDGSKASFSGFVTLRSEPKSCYFTHPAGETMSVDAVKGTVKANYSSQDGSHKPFLYGKTEYDPEGMTVGLKHLGAVLEITVDTPGVTHISLAGNEIEPLSPVIINPEDDTIEKPAEAVTQITVPVQKEGKTYIFVPPVNFEKGFSLVCSDGTEDNYFVKSFSDGTTGGYDFTSRRGAKIPITISGEFKQFAVTSSDLTIVHSRNDAGLLTGTTVSFKMSKTGSPDKLIDSWGATLTDAKGNVVRTYSSKAAITGSTVTMDVSAGNIFLEAGAYTFTPYFYMYGEPVSLEKQAVTKTINGPGIVLNINGSTSYDKYRAGNADGANLHANTLLSGLSVSTNVAAETISEFICSLVGDDNTVIDVSNPSVGVASSSTIATFGDKTCPKFQGYTMSAGITIGNIKKEATRVFHITGLPYEGDFRTGNPTSWNPGWYIGNAEYSDGGVFFEASGLVWEERQYAIRSPRFHIPSSVSVLPLADVSCKKRSQVMNVMACARDETAVSFGTASIAIHYNSSFKSGDYAQSSVPVEMLSDKPALMFACKVPGLYGIRTYRIKIQYN